MIHPIILIIAQRPRPVRPILPFWMFRCRLIDSAQLFRPYTRFATQWPFISFAIHIHQNTSHLEIRWAPELSCNATIHPFKDEAFRTCAISGSPTEDIVVKHQDVLQAELSNRCSRLSLVIRLRGALPSLSISPFARLMRVYTAKQGILMRVAHGCNSVAIKL